MGKEIWDQKKHSNIQSGFEATGLVPFSPDRVLSKIPKTPSPPSTSHSNESFGIGQTPANLYQLKMQKKIEYLKNVVSLSTVDKALKKVIKTAEEII